MRARAGANCSPEETEESGRALDVCEEERDRPRREILPLSGLTIHADESRRQAAVHCRAVFDTLSDKLQATLGGLGRSGRLDEEAISKAMREIRLALLEADVNLEVARDFTAAVKERALGQDVAEEPHPGAAGRQDRARGADGSHGLRATRGSLSVVLRR